MNEVDTLLSWIKESNKTVFFGGAGVSTESGLKDFRSKDGLYNQQYDYPPEEILSHHFFVKESEEFYKFYTDKLNTNGCKPNITHIVLAELEKMGFLSSVITQNIDGFHQEAGSSHVLELHGSILRNHCVSCHKFYDASYVFSQKGVPHCDCGGIIKPDVVLYEESLDSNVMREAIHEISTCDLLIIGGTSLSVYPAASFIQYFHGGHMVLINRDHTPYDQTCDLVIHDSLGNVFQKIKKEICK